MKEKYGEKGEKQTCIQRSERQMSGKRKRQPYKVSKACNECRKRKIKCTGTFSCSSCVIYGSKCGYDQDGAVRSRTTERSFYKNSRENLMKIRSLQDSIEELAG